MNPLVKPRFTLLTDEQIQFVHQRSLEVLRKVGVRVDSPRALELLLDSEGVRKAPDSAEGEGRVVFDPSVVEWALESAPQVVPVYDRGGEEAFRLGEDRTRFGIGATNLHFQDPVNEDLARFTREHIAISTRLAHDLPNFDMVSTMGVVQDYPPATADLYATLELIANTTKPIVLLISAHGLFEAALDLAEELHPGLEDKPFLVPYLNPVTPLVINEGTAEKLMITVERGLPVIYSNYSMAGMSTPITPAGTLTLLNAELLAGLVLAQLTRQGAPVILGSLPAFFDMKTLQDFHGPQTVLLNQACAEMMGHYRIPHAGTSGSGNGWRADLLSGGHVWMTHLLSTLGNSGMAPFVGSTQSSKAFSPLMTVYANDVIGQAVRMSQGFPLDEEELDLETMASQGPGGSFVTSPLTLERVREAYYESPLFPRIGLESWEQKGRPRFEDLLREQTLQLLDAPTIVDDHDDLVARGEAFIEKLG